ncbi:MAG TPA: hypothetical protein VFB66_00060 [Tepidisphaeraceae bacterium]|nr:hypothetical protein [Tepidisphaeraceae bacterium]
MAIAKKGSRRICVDGVHYRWRAREVSPVGVRVVVQKEDPPGALLVLKLLRDRAVSDVTPAEVAAWVQRAICDGWDPHRPGPPAERDVTE